MNYSWSPSLAYRTSVLVAGSLWTKTNIQSASGLDLNRRVDCCRLREQWPNILERIEEEEISLQIAIQLRISNLHKILLAMGEMISSWLDYNIIMCDLSMGCPDQFIWTQHGTIDFRKTAEYIVTNDSTLDLATRYRLACLYCLDAKIVYLWDQASDFHGKHLERIRTEESFLVVYWSHYLENEMAVLQENIQQICGKENASVFEYAFRGAAMFGSVPGAIYFLQKLTEEEKAQPILETADYVAQVFNMAQNGMKFPQESLVDILRLLLSVMTEEQQTVLLRNRALKVLLAFLQWPWERFFLETATYTVKTLKETKFYCLMVTVTAKQISSLLNRNEVFKILWQKSLPLQKKYIMDKCHEVLESILSQKIPQEYIYNIRENVNPRLLWRRLFSALKLDICERLMEDETEEYKLLKFFIKRSIIDEDPKSFKASFKVYFMGDISEVSKYKKKSFKKFSKFVDDAEKEKRAGCSDSRYNLRSRQS